MRALAAVLTLLLLAGCATPRPQMTREEWLQTTGREFQGVTKDQALAAAEKVLRLADGDDFVIAHNEEGFRASRRWIVYLVFAAAVGTDYWELKASPAPGGVRVTVAVSQDSQALTPTATARGDWVATTGPMAGSPVMGNALYDLFWARAEYLLGLREDWMTCPQAQERVKAKTVWGDNGELCNAFNVADTQPTDTDRVLPLSAQR